MTRADSPIGSGWLALIAKGASDPEATHRESSAQRPDTGSTGRWLREDLAVATTDPHRPTRYRSASMQASTGSAFAAEQVSLQRTVTVKSARSQDDQQALRLEAWITGFLDHPHIVTIHDAGDDFLVLQQLSGHSLLDLIGSTDPVGQIRILLAVIDALLFAHEHGILHRDLKPANILIGDLGEVVVTNWGLACTWDGAPATPAWVPRLSDDLVCAGTPAYCPPEVAAGQGDAVSPAADIFALGACLYTCLNGHPPFIAADTHGSLALAVINQAAPIDPRQPGRLRRLVEDCMATDVAARPPLATIQTELRQWLAQRNAAEEAGTIAALAAEDPPDRHASYDRLRRQAANCARGLGLDSDNEELQRLAVANRRAFGLKALTEGDLYWAVAQLQPFPQEHAAAVDALRRRERSNHRRRRLRLIVRLSMSVTIALLLVVPLFIADSDRRLHSERIRQAAELLASTSPLPALTDPSWSRSAQQQAVVVHRSLGLVPGHHGALERLRHLTASAVDHAQHTGRIGIAPVLLASLRRHDVSSVAELETRFRAVVSLREQILEDRRSWIADLIRRCTESIPWEIADPRVARDRPEGRRHEDDRYGVLMTPTVDHICAWDGAETADLIAPLVDHPLPLCRRIAARALRSRPDLEAPALRRRLATDADPAVRESLQSETDR